MVGNKQYETKGYLSNQNSVSDYFLEVVNWSDYYPGGSIMPGRSFNSSDYRYGGAGGQEKVDEIAGSGNHYTTENWEYDPRLIRRWEIDPMTRKYPHQSPYSAFNNNPIYFVDPTGNEGEATVDKKEKTVSVTANFYYDKSNPNFKSQAITEDRTFTSGPFEGETFKSEESKMGENGWGSQSWTTTDDDGNEWTVNYQVNFIGLDNQAAVDKKLAEDPTGNALVYDNEMSSAGQWRPSSRTLAIGPGRRLDSDATTTIHEIGHSLGLPHANEIPGSPLYGTSSPTPGSDNGKTTYGIMSYAQKRAIQNYEVKMSVIKSINLANSVKDNSVRIHIKGSSKRDSVLLK